MVLSPHWKFFGTFRYCHIKVHIFTACCTLWSSAFSMMGKLENLIKIFRDKKKFQEARLNSKWEVGSDA